MDMLKKIFPFAFTDKKDVASLVIYVIIHVVAGAVLGVISALLAFIPVFGFLIGLVFSLVDLYILISLVLCFLDYFKILK